jgi:hypothetical protein
MAVSMFTLRVAEATWSRSAASLWAVAVAMIGATVTSFHPISSALAPRVEAIVPATFRVVPRAAARSTLSTLCGAMALTAMAMSPV